MNRLTAPWYRRKRRLYRGGRTHPWTRLLNRAAAWKFVALRPLFLNRGVVLDVRGRTSGRTVRLPLVVLRQGGERYLVSMLGEQAQWVLNVRADGGRAVLHDGRVEAVRLLDVPVDRRPPLLKRYLQIAPGARPHIAVDRRAPLADFVRIAADVPVFRVEPRTDDGAPTA